jgi:hypothetical protein
MSSHENDEQDEGDDSGGKRVEGEEAGRPPPPRCEVAVGAAAAGAEAVPAQRLLSKAAK